MIAMAQAITRIILMISMRRLLLMVQSTRIARKKLFPIDLKTNINHCRVLEGQFSCFIMDIIIRPWIERILNDSVDNQFLIQIFRKSFFFVFFGRFSMHMALYRHEYIILIVNYDFSFHLFKNYGNYGDCIDIELREVSVQTAENQRNLCRCSYLVDDRVLPSKMKPF